MNDSRYTPEEHAMIESVMGKPEPFTIPEPVTNQGPNRAARRAAIVMTDREPRNLVLAPHPALKTVARPVTRFGPGIASIAEDLVRVLREYDGYGLSANQIGVTLRIIAADAGDGLHVLVNPRIMGVEGAEMGIEGCLSQPGILCEVERATSIIVRAVDTRGLPIFLRKSGLLARIIQHEIDHLDGFLLTDRGRVVEAP